MDRPEDVSGSTRTTTSYQRESDTRWAHRNLGGAWWLALAVIPLLLAALAAAVRGGAIEKDLDARATAVLQKSGVDGVDVSFSGRDATVAVAPGATVDAATLDRAKGYVADVTGVRIVDVDDADVSASGQTGTDTSSDSSGATPSASSSAAPEECDPAALQAKIDQILGDNKIAFGEASAELAGDSADEVDQVAGLLAPCADVAVTVSGHTDTRGAKSAYSQKRADAVKAALVAGGVADSAITAVGKRDADPLGDNATSEGRILNRYADIVVG